MKQRDGHIVDYCTRTCRAVETVHRLTLDTRQINGVVQRTDDAMVTTMRDVSMRAVVRLAERTPGPSST